MLAPEVWNLPPPASRSTVIQDIKKIRECFRRQIFNHSALLVIPGIEPPEAVTQALSEDSDYYHVTKLPLIELFNIQFINLFVRNGSLSMHSVGTKLDMDSGVAITPDGTLVLSLESDLFQKMGLNGMNSRFVANRRFVKLDLKSPLFTNESKELKKIVSKLKNVPELQFDVVCAWEPNDESLCPSSLASWFNSASYSVRCCSNKVAKNTHCDVEVPEFDVDPFEIQEWVGFLQLGCQMNDQRAISSYAVPTPSRVNSKVTTLQWTGFLIASRVSSALDRLESWLKERAGNSWALLSAFGMEDSVTTFDSEEHNFYLDGDFSTTAILHARQTSVGIVHVSSCKATKGRKRKRREQI